MTKETKALVKATAPLIKKHGEAITQTMYPILFERYPDAKILFKNASDNQHKKLAASIYAYAANIDKLEALSKAIETIAAAHVKTAIKPEHYPWVRDALLSAIKEVLGNEATPEVIGAWGEAYDFLANVLIEREKELYQNS
ncbi:MAG: hypothetical protein DSZ03_06825 [Sulfurimonas sp.]|nr:MAG: hypothetical protein DSZ03_06825 [Sulfurimonas sp.]